MSNPEEYQQEDRSPEALAEKALALGCEVEYAAADLLQIDIDDTATLERFDRLWDMVQDRGLLPGAVVAERRRSRSWLGWHVTVRLAEPMPAERRILFQALLGSDEVREILNLGRGGESMCLFRPLPLAEVATWPGEDDDLLPF